MKIRNHFIGLWLLPLLLYSCNGGGSEDLPPVEQRVSEAVTGLRQSLESPVNGWKVEYQPTDESGVFLILLKFDDNGNVSVKSDLAANDGEFFDQTLAWDINNRLGLQLVFQTYGVFHYLFEQDGATFGAEFEFIYQNETGGNLVFTSASDLSGSPTTVVFQPAAAGDENLLSRDIATNLNLFETNSPKALQSPQPKQQIILKNSNVSVLWSLDPAKRIVQTLLAGVGTDLEDPGFKAVTLNHTSGYKLQGGQLVLLTPLQFALNGQQYSISAINFSDFTNTGPEFCSSGTDNGPEYQGTISGIGPVSMVGSLYDPEGTNFQPVADYPYSVNIPFLFDETGASLSDGTNIIAEKFPDAVAFFMFYGYTSTTDSLPANAVGFAVSNNQGGNDLILREFNPTQTVGNRIHIMFTDKFYHSGTPGPDDDANLAAITDKLFEGGNVYASDYPVEGLTVFNLFNPCNEYEIFLVQ